MAEPVAPAPSPTTPPAPTTLGALRAAGHRLRSVKAELRENLLARLASGTDRFPGIVGFDETVLPELERALLAGHDVVLLGERGQGKTRLVRTLVGLLDEWTPVLAGSELHEHPFDPITPWGHRQVAELGEAAPVTWLHRSDRYGEKLATPDTSVGDLIGDVDPVKIAEGRTLGDPETIHFGLVPRTHRGIFGINELPDLAERIQVALLNVLEERDIQVRGYRLRLPLDVLLVASANPEDYTNRGRIITPLKDRFGAEVRTHYPLDLDDEVALVRQEAHLEWEGAGAAAPDDASTLVESSDDGRLDTLLAGRTAAPVVPEALLEVVARFTRAVRESPAVDDRSGVSARFAVAAAETVAASAVRRAALVGEPAVARVSDLWGVVPVLRGKVEFEQAEEGREVEVLAHLLRRAVAQTFRSRMAGVDLSDLATRFAEGATATTGELVPAQALLEAVGPVRGLSEVLRRLGVPDGGESPGLAASAVEMCLEGLHLNRKLSKEEVDGRTVYGPGGGGSGGEGRRRRGEG